MSSARFLHPARGQGFHRCLNTWMSAVSITDRPQQTDITTIQEVLRSIASGCIER